MTNFYSDLHTLVNSKDIVEYLLSHGYKKNGSGSCRDFYVAPTPKVLTIDGVNTQVATGIKVMKNWSGDKYLSTPMGILQNKAETQSGINKFQGLLVVSETVAETNDAGVLAPILNHSTSGLWLETIVLETFNIDDRKKLDSRCAYRYGITFSDIRMMLNEFFQRTVLKKDVPQYNNQYVERLCEVISKFKISPYDLTIYNVGWSEITDSLVMMDYGGTVSVLKEYDKARELREMAIGLDW